MMLSRLWRNSQTVSGMSTNMVAVVIPLLAAIDLGASSPDPGLGYRVHA